MALEFGFGKYDRGDSEHEAFWKNRFDSLSDVDKQFYHNSLPFYLMFTDIHIVTKESIPHIVSRLMALYPDIYEEISKYLDKSNLTDYLHRFIGFSANVCTTSSAQYIKRILESMKRKIPTLTPNQIAAIDKYPDISTLS